MGTRRLLAGFVVSALLVAGCASIQIYDPSGSGGSSSFSGVGGSSSFDTSAQASTSSGLSGADAGWTTSAGNGGGSLKYLCGGSNPACSPDLGSWDCTQGGSAGLGGVPDASKFACQLEPVDGGLAARCGMAGTAGNGGVCSANDPCQAGFGCIATDVTPICRQYCCDSLESCPKDTYCTRAPLVAAASDIPVCMPVSSCELLNNATCMAGLTCAIVRDDGTTSCIPPGPGLARDPCPCAAGYTCSPADNTCIELCHTATPGECGPNGSCQGGTKPYPSGIGFCVPY